MCITLEWACGLGASAGRWSHPIAMEHPTALEPSSRTGHLHGVGAILSRWGNYTALESPHRDGAFARRWRLPIALEYPRCAGIFTSHRNFAWRSSIRMEIKYPHGDQSPHARKQCGRPTPGVRHDSETDCSDLPLIPQDWFNSTGVDECEPGTTCTILAII